jgi:dolichol kinase
MAYFLVFGILVLKYALKSRNYPEKSCHPAYFKNEVLIALLFFFIVAGYPFFFNQFTDDPLVKAGVYFHLWNSITINLICWQVYFFIAQRNNKKNKTEMTHEQWKERFLEIHSSRNHVVSDLKRKLSHLIPPALVIGMYYLGPVFAPYLSEFNWTAKLFSIYGAMAFGFHYLFVMIIADLTRLNKFHKLGEFAREWCEDALHPSEIHTFTSANTMMLAFVPFYFSPITIAFTVVAVAPLSDGMASVIGKSLGKKRNSKSPKTLEGYLAGFITAYLVVIFMGTIIPHEGVSTMLLHIMALVAAFGILMVDVYSSDISDNFLNSLVTGSLLWVIYFVFVVM